MLWFLTIWSTIYFEFNSAIMMPNSIILTLRPYEKSVGSDGKTLKKMSATFIITL